MSRMLEAELLKLRTTRTFLALTGAALALSLLITVLVALLQKDWTTDDVNALFTNTDLTGLFILLLGAIGMAGEWRHRTITGTVLATPQRVRLFVAKLISYAVAGVVLSLIVNLAAMGVGTLILSLRDLPTLSAVDLADILWRNLTLAALYGALGVSVGALLRNSAAAIVLLLVIGFLIEPILSSIAPDVYKFGPLGGLPQGVNRGAGNNSNDLLAPGLALLAMFAWVAVLGAAAGATFNRRDLT